MQKSVVQKLRSLFLIIFFGNALIAMQESGMKGYLNLLHKEGFLLNNSLDDLKNLGEKCRNNKKDACTLLNKKFKPFNSLCSTDIENMSTYITLDDLGRFHNLCYFRREFMDRILEDK